MIAESISLGPIKALCLNPKSVNRMKMITGSNHCEAWEDGSLGAIDAPGNEDAYNNFNEPDLTI